MFFGGLFIARSLRRGKNGKKLLEEDLTYRIRGCVYSAYRELGAGFLEKVYEKALLIELKQAGLQAQSQVSLEVQSTYNWSICG